MKGKFKRGVLISVLLMVSFGMSACDGPALPSGVDFGSLSSDDESILQRNDAVIPILPENEETSTEAENYGFSYSEGQLHEKLGFEERYIYKTLGNRQKDLYKKSMPP